MTTAKEQYDIVIIGSGPAGLQAAIHGARAKTDVAVLGRLKRSSLHKAHVENYCCTSNLSSGEEMLAQGKDQAERFGADFFDEDVLDIEENADGGFVITLESRTIIRTWTVILAMGISRNRLKVPGEKELQAKGVSYCVDCDGNFYKNQPVAVVGEGSAAAAGALTLLMIAGEVHLIYRSLDVDERLVDHIQSSSIITHPGRWISAIQGEYAVEAVLLDNDETVKVSAVFVELGAKGALEIATKIGVALDMEDIRFIQVDRKQQTNIPGAYAAGDICGPPWQMAKAIGEGCVAGLEAAAYVKKRRRK